MSFSVKKTGGRMWHEARKQEKKIRGMLVDYRRRAERRRDYYEKIVSTAQKRMQWISSFVYFETDQCTTHYFYGRYVSSSFSWLTFIIVLFVPLCSKYHCEQKYFFDT